jgi:hypothetical protein
MTTTRFFLRQSQTEPTTGGTVYDLGESAATGTIDVSGTATVLTEFGRWVRQLSSAQLPSGTASIPYAVSIASQASTTESRVVVARLNSSGTIQESFNGGTYTGTAATTISGTATLSGFTSGDLVAVIIENRRTSGGGSRTTTINTTTASYIDVTAPNQGTAANLSATATAGDATGEHPPLMSLGTAENLSVTATTDDSVGEAVDNKGAIRFTAPFVFSRRDSEPADPAVGEVYYNVIDKVLYIFDGTLWDPLNSSINTAVKGASISLIIALS